MILGTPIASRKQSRIWTTFQISAFRTAPTPLGQPNPDDIVAVNLRGVDQARKRLVQFYQAARTKARTGDASDLRAMQRIMDGFDDHIEQSISNGLFSGDPFVHWMALPGQSGVVQ